MFAAGSVSDAGSIEGFAQRRIAVCRQTRKFEDRFSLSSRLPR
jgi:hypothetical protein